MNRYEKYYISTLEITPKRGRSVSDITMMILQDLRRENHCNVARNNALCFGGSRVGYWLIEGKNAFTPVYCSLTTAKRLARKSFLACGVGAVCDFNTGIIFIEY